MAEQTENRPRGTARPTDGTFALRAIDSADRMTRSLSPWVREMLDGANTPADRGSLVGRLMRRRADESVSFLSTLAILRRFHRIVTRTTAWKANVGTVSPNLFEKFSEEMFKNWDMGANNISALLKINRQEEALEMPLAGEVGGPAATPARPPANAAPAMTMEEIRRRVAEARQFESLSPSSVPNFVKSQDTEKPDVRPVAQHPSNRPARPAPPRPTDQPIARQLPGQTPPVPPAPPAAQQPSGQPATPSPRMMRRRMARQVEYLSIPDSAGEDGGESEGGGDSEAAPPPQFDTGPPGLDWLFPETENSGPDWFAPTSAEATQPSTSQPTLPAGAPLSSPVKSRPTVVRSVRRSVRAQAVRPHLVRSLTRQRPAQASQPVANRLRPRIGSRPENRATSKPAVPSIAQRAVGRLALSASGQLLASRPQILLEHVHRQATGPSRTSLTGPNALPYQPDFQHQSASQDVSSTPALSVSESALDAMLPALSAIDRPPQASPLQRQSEGGSRLAPVSLADFALAVPQRLRWRVDPPQTEAPVDTPDQPEPPARRSGESRPGQAEVRPAARQPVAQRPVTQRPASERPASVRTAARAVVQRTLTDGPRPSAPFRPRRQTSTSQSTARQSAARQPLERSPALARLQSLPLRPSPTVMRLADIAPFDTPLPALAESQSEAPGSFQPESPARQLGESRRGQAVVRPAAEQPATRAAVQPRLTNGSPDDSPSSALLRPSSQTGTHQSAALQSFESARTQSVLQRLLLRPLPTVMRLVATSPFDVAAQAQAESRSEEPVSVQPVVTEQPVVTQRPVGTQHPAGAGQSAGIEEPADTERAESVQRVGLAGLELDALPSPAELRHEFEPVSGAWRSTLLRSQPVASALLPAESDGPLRRSPTTLSTAFATTWPDAGALLGSQSPPLSQAQTSASSRLGRAFLPDLELDLARFRRANRTPAASGELAQPAPPTLATARPAPAFQRLSAPPTRRVNRTGATRSAPTLLERVTGRDFAGTRNDLLGRGPLALAALPASTHLRTEQPRMERPQTQRPQTLSSEDAPSPGPGSGATLQRQPLQPSAAPLRPLHLRPVSRTDERPVATSARAHTRLLLQRAGATHTPQPEQPATLQDSPRGLRLPARRSERPLPPAARLGRPARAPVSAGTEAGASPRQSPARFVGAMSGLPTFTLRTTRLGESGVVAQRLAAAHTRLEPVSRLWRSAQLTGDVRPPESVAFAAGPAPLADLAEPAIFAQSALSIPTGIALSTAQAGVDTPLPLAPANRWAAQSPAQSLTQSPAQFLAQSPDGPATPRVLSAALPAAGEVLVDRMAVGRPAQVRRRPAPSVERQVVARSQPRSVPGSGPTLLERVERRVYPPQREVRSGTGQRVAAAASVAERQPLPAAGTERPSVGVFPVPRLLQRRHQPGETAQAALQLSQQLRRVVSVTPASSAWTAEPVQRRDTAPVSDRLDSLGQFFASAPPSELSARLAVSSTSAALNQRVELPLSRPVASGRLDSPQQVLSPATADAALESEAVSTPARRTPSAQSASLQRGSVTIAGDVRQDPKPAHRPVRGAKLTATLLDLTRQPTDAVGLPRQRTSDKSRGDIPTPGWRLDASRSIPQFLSGPAPASAPVRPLSELVLRRDFGDIRRRLLQRSAPIDAQRFAPGEAFADEVAPTPKTLLSPGAIGRSASNLTVRQQNRHQVQPVSDLWRSDLLHDAEPSTLETPTLESSTVHSGRDLAGPAAISGDELLRPSGLLPSPGNRPEAREATQPSIPAAFVPLELALNRLLRASTRTDTGGSSAAQSAPPSAGEAADTPTLSQRAGATAPSQRRGTVVSGTISPQTPRQRALVTGAGRIGPTQSAAAAVQRLEAGGWRFKRSRPVPDASAAPVERVQRALTGLATGHSHPLPDRPRTLLERVLQRDFAGVRVQMASLGPLGIEAAAQGNTVYLDRAQADLNRSDSLALLGHELTHVAAGGAAPLLAENRVQRSPDRTDMPLAHPLAPSLTQRLSRQLVQMSLAEEERVAEQVEAVMRRGRGAEPRGVVSTAGPSTQRSSAQRPPTPRISPPGTPASVNASASRRPVQRAASIAAGSRSVAALAQRRLATSHFAPVSQSWPAQDFAGADEPVGLLDALGWRLSRGEQASASPSAAVQRGAAGGDFGGEMPLSQAGLASGRAVSASLGQPAQDFTSAAGASTGSSTGPVSASATVDLLEERGWRFKRREGTPVSPTRGAQRSAGNQRTTAIQRAAAELQRGPSGGMPLPRRPRTLMERVLQRDFSGVRLQAAGLEPLGVEAAAHGQTVYLQRSALAQLDRPDNLALLGHELTHVAVGTNPSVRRSEQMAQPQNGAEGAGLMPLSLPSVNQLRGSVQREEQAAGQVEQGIQALLRQGSVQREPLAPRPSNGPGSSPGPVKATRAVGNGSQGRIDTRVGSGGTGSGFASSASGDLPVVRRRAVLGQSLASLPALAGGVDVQRAEAEGPVLDGVSTESMPVVQRFLDRPSLAQNGLAEGTPGASDPQTAVAPAGGSTGATTHYPLQRALQERIQRSPDEGGDSDVDDEIDDEMDNDQEPDWDGLAERIYPLIRRMIEMERERRPL